MYTISLTNRIILSDHAAKFEFSINDMMFIFLTQGVSIIDMRC